MSYFLKVFLFKVFLKRIDEKLTILDKEIAEAKAD